MNHEPKTLSSLDACQEERLTRWILHGASLTQLQLWLDQEFDIHVAPSVVAEHRDRILNQLIQLAAIPNLPIPKTSQATQDSPATAPPPNNLQSEFPFPDSRFTPHVSLPPRSLFLAFFMSHLAHRNGKILSDLLKIVGQVRSQQMTQRRQDFAVFQAETEKAKFQRDKERREDFNRPFTSEEARAIIAKVENITGPFPPESPYYIGTKQ